MQRLKRAKLLSLSYADLTAKARQRWVTRALAVLTPGTQPTAENGPKPSQRKPATSNALSLDQPATTLRAVTSRVASPLGRLGIKTVRDLVYLFPRRHNEIREVSQLRSDEEQATVATIWEARATRMGRTLQATEAVVGDDTGNIRVVWYNQPYLATRLKAGTRYVFSGRVSTHRGRPALDSPHHEELRDGSGLEELVQAGRLFPVYPLTESITQQTLRRIIREALARAVDAVEEALPRDVLQRNNLLPVRKALWQAHYPDGWQSYEAARRRLAFEELFLLQLGVLGHRRAVESGAGGVTLVAPPGVMDTFLASLPFNLTAAQHRVLDEVLADISHGDKQMSRLLQGEVGSGKTVVALAALLVAATCGYQGAIMAPTEVLAEQHFLTVNRLLKGLA
ncbi:MAG: DEAD/DEAH box helicase, partial [Dehalococcoidia bacterium]